MWLSSAWITLALAWNQSMELIAIYSSNSTVAHLPLTERARSESFQEVTSESHLLSRIHQKLELHVEVNAIARMNAELSFITLLKKILFEPIII